VLEPLRRVGFLEVGQQPADLTQFTDALGTHAHGDPLRGAEQVAQHRHVKTCGVLEQQGRAAPAQSAVADFSHLQNGGDGCLDALEFTALFQSLDEIAKIGILHLSFKPQAASCKQSEKCRSSNVWSEAVPTAACPAGQSDRHKLQAVSNCLQLAASGWGVSSWRASSTGRIRRWSWCPRSEEHTSELQSRENLVCRLLLE